MNVEDSVAKRLVPIISDINDPGFLEIVFIAFAVSFAVCALVIATERWHGRYSFDEDLSGVQKVHKRQVPRTGGIALFTAVAAIPLFAGWQHHGVPMDAPTAELLLALWLASVPAFLAGLTEDLTKKVSVRTRFCAILVSALLAAWLSGAVLPRFDVWGLDAALGLLPLSLPLTAFAVAGVTNAVNIIDGFNGVAGAAIAVVLTGIAYLCWREGDLVLARMALAGIGATLGFLALNYPTGRLFMGDGGAYFLGFWAGELAVLAIVRNPGINTWQLLAIFAYPVVEVLFSIYRRKILRDSAARAPDRLHLHSLFYRRIARHKLSARRFPWMCNAGVACFVTSWLGTATLAAILLGDTTAGALAVVMLQVLAYIAVYMRLVRGHWGRCRNPAIILGLLPQLRARAA